MTDQYAAVKFLVDREVAANKKELTLVLFIVEEDTKEYLNQDRFDVTVEGNFTKIRWQ